jgi:hypothetical protein
MDGKLIANTWTQKINAQINGAVARKAFQSFVNGFVHVFGTHRGHDSQTAHGVKDSTDNTPVNAMVRKVPHQLWLHGQAGHNACALDAFNLQAHPLIEKNFLFVNVAQGCDELWLKFNIGGKV